jgi:mitofusin
LQRDWDSVITRKKQTEKTRNESKVAQKWFTNLLKESDDSKRGVERIDVEGVAPGLSQATDE